MDTVRQLGMRVARRRALQGWTQQQLADAVGVTQGYISQIESRQRRVNSRELLEWLGTALQVSVDDLVGAVRHVRDRPGELIHQAIPYIRAALDDAGEPVGRHVNEVAGAVRDVQVARMACDYGELARTLPALLTDTRLLAAGGDPRAAGLHVRSCVAAAIAERPLGYLDLASRLADRA